MHVAFVLCPLEYPTSNLMHRACKKQQQRNLYLQGLPFTLLELSSVFWPSSHPLKTCFFQQMWPLKWMQSNKTFWNFAFLYGREYDSLIFNFYYKFPPFTMGFHTTWFWNWAEFSTSLEKTPTVEMLRIVLFSLSYSVPWTLLVHPFPSVVLIKKVISIMGL